MTDDERCPACGGVMQVPEYISEPWSGDSMGPLASLCEDEFHRQKDEPITGPLLYILLGVGLIFFILFTLPLLMTLTVGQLALIGLGIAVIMVASLYAVNKVE